MTSMQSTDTGTANLARTINQDNARHSKQTSFQGHITFLSEKRKTPCSLLKCLGGLLTDQAAAPNHQTVVLVICLRALLLYSRNLAALG